MTLFILSFYHLHGTGPLKWPSFPSPMIVIVIILEKERRKRRAGLNAREQSSRSVGLIPPPAMGRGSGRTKHDTEAFLYQTTCVRKRSPFHSTTKIRGISTIPYPHPQYWRSNVTVVTTCSCWYHPCETHPGRRHTWHHRFVPTLLECRDQWSTSTTVACCRYNGPPLIRPNNIETLLPVLPASKLPRLPPCWQGIARPS